MAELVAMGSAAGGLPGRPGGPAVAARGVVRWSLLAGPGLLCLAALALPADLQDALAWERGAPAAGEWWRLWSGHLVHYGVGHALANGAALLALAFWLGRRPGGGGALLLTMALAAPLLSLALLWMAPALGVYRGASGLVVLLAAVAARTAVARPGERGLGALLLAGLLLKVAGEACGVALPASLPAGVAVVWQAHALGLLLGLAGGIRPAPGALPVWRKRAS